MKINTNKICYCFIFFAILGCSKMGMGIQSMDAHRGEILEFLKKERKLLILKEGASNRRIKDEFGRSFDLGVKIGIFIKKVGGEILRHPLKGYDEEGPFSMLSEEQKLALSIFFNLIYRSEKNSLLEDMKVSSNTKSLLLQYSDYAIEKYQTKKRPFDTWYLVHSRETGEMEFRFMRDVSSSGEEVCGLYLSKNVRDGNINYTHLLEKTKLKNDLKDKVEYLVRSSSWGTIALGARIRPDKTEFYKKHLMDTYDSIGPSAQLTIDMLYRSLLVIQVMTARASELVGRCDNPIVFSCTDSTPQDTYSKLMKNVVAMHLDKDIYNKRMAVSHVYEQYSPVNENYQELFENVSSGESAFLKFGIYEPFPESEVFHITDNYYTDKTRYYPSKGNRDHKISNIVSHWIRKSSLDKEHQWFNELTNVVANFVLRPFIEGNQSGWNNLLTQYPKIFQDYPNSSSLQCLIPKESEVYHMGENKVLTKEEAKWHFIGEYEKFTKVVRHVRMSRLGLPPEENSPSEWILLRQDKSYYPTKYSDCYVGSHSGHVVIGDHLSQIEISLSTNDDLPKEFAIFAGNQMTELDKRGKLMLKELQKRNNGTGILVTFPRVCLVGSGGIFEEPNWAKRIGVCM